MSYQRAASMRPLGGYEIADHLCRMCNGRILTKTDPVNGKQTCRCSNCGFSAVVAVSRICWCGAKMPATGRNAGLRCTKNDNPTPEMPGEIVVRCEDDVGLDKPKQTGRYADETDDPEV